jgi:hypothetical protein
MGTLGGRPAVGPKNLGGNSLGHNLCDKTDVDFVESLPFIRLGTVVTAVLCGAPPRTVSLAKALYGHPNIYIRFLTTSARTPAEVAASQQMESGILLQETEDAPQIKLLRALRLTFSTAA